MMKGFKFGLVSLLLGLFGLTCFSSASSFTYTGHVDVSSLGSNKPILFLPIPYSDFNPIGAINQTTLDCSFSNVSNNFDYKVYYYMISNNRDLGNATNNTVYTMSDNSTLSFNAGNTRVLIYQLQNTSTITTSFDYSCVVSNDNIKFSCPVCSTCDYSGYVAVSDITTNYCVSNDLCPVLSGVSWSELVINDIVHESAPLINITIPEEYNWDYSVDDNEFTLDISGYNVDYAYIDGIINTQKGKPNNIDFNNVITGLIPLLVPGLFIILFIWFIFRFIKKIF